MAVPYGFISHFMPKSNEPVFRMGRCVSERASEVCIYLMRSLNNNPLNQKWTHTIELNWMFWVNTEKLRRWLRNPLKRKWNRRNVENVCVQVQHFRWWLNEGMLFLHIHEFHISLENMLTTLPSSRYPHFANSWNSRMKLFGHGLPKLAFSLALRNICFLFTNLVSDSVRQVTNRSLKLSFDFEISLFSDAQNL